MDGADVGVWEGAARALLEAVGGDDPPQDAFRLAERCGLQARPWGRRWAMLAGSEIRYPGQARPVRQHGLVAHELGHWTLMRASEPDSERAASYVGAALMLPWRAFERDLRETEWDLEKLQGRHPNCSAEMIARRVVELRDAVATVIDAGRVRVRVGSPWAEPPGRLCERERALVEAAAASGAAARDGLGTCMPLFDGRHRRMVLVVDRY